MVSGAGSVLTLYNNPNHYKNQVKDMTNEDKKKYCDHCGLLVAELEPIIKKKLGKIKNWTMNVCKTCYAKLIQNNEYRYFK